MAVFVWEMVFAAPAPRRFPDILHEGGDPSPSHVSRKGKREGMVLHLFLYFWENTGNITVIFLLHHSMLIYHRCHDDFSFSWFDLFPFLGLLPFLMRSPGKACDGSG